MFFIKHPPLLIFYALLFVACSSKSPPSLENQNARVPPATSSSAAVFPEKSSDSFVPTDDTSLFAKEYLQKGLPAYDRVWSGQDLAKALEVLTSIAQKDPNQLPKYQSERSGSVFKRLISQEGLSQFLDRSLPLTQRMERVLIYVESITQLFKLYEAAARQGTTVKREVYELAGSQLHSSFVLFQLVEQEFLPTLNPSDPNYDVRMKGFDQMKNGLSLSFKGVLLMLWGAEVDTSTRKRLLGALQETLPPVFPELSKEDRTQLLQVVRALEEDQSQNSLQAEITTLHKQLEQLQVEN